MTQCDPWQMVPRSPLHVFQPENVDYKADVDAIKTELMSASTDNVPCKTKLSVDKHPSISAYVCFALDCQTRKADLRAESRKHNDPMRRLK